MRAPSPGLGLPCPTFCPAPTLQVLTPIWWSFLPTQIRASLLATSSLHPRKRTAGACGPRPGVFEGRAGGSGGKWVAPAQPALRFRKWGLRSFLSARHVPGGAGWLGGQRPGHSALSPAAGHQVGGLSYRTRVWELVSLRPCRWPAVRPLGLPGREACLPWLLWPISTIGTPGPARRDSPSGGRGRVRRPAGPTPAGACTPSARTLPSLSAHRTLPALTDRGAASDGWSWDDTPGTPGAHWVSAAGPDPFRPPRPGLLPSFAHTSAPPGVPS